MAENWTHIRIPQSTHQQLLSIQTRLEDARSKGLVEMPEVRDCVRMWHVVDRLIEHYEARKRRRTKSAKTKKERKKARRGGDEKPLGSEDRC